MPDKSVPLPRYIERAEAYLYIGPGWRGLVDEVYDLIDSTDDRVHVTYIKEKFATLRVGTFAESVRGDAFDFTRFSEQLRRLELKAGTICEQCGATCTTKSNHGWLVALCDVCYKTKYYGEF